MTKIQLKRATSNRWQQLNPVLSNGEPGFEKDTFKLKIGNGTLSWNDLPYVAGGFGGDNGPLRYTLGSNFLLNCGNVSSNLETQPSFLDAYESETSLVEGIHFGYDDDGLWFSGNANSSLVYYPVRTNFVFNSEVTTTVIFTIYHDDNCSDHGIALFNESVQPQWSWGASETRIALQIDCGEPYISGLQSEVSADISLTVGNYYTFKLIYNPSASSVTVSIYDGDSVDDTLLDTFSINERLTSGQNYKIGFGADQDNAELRSYYKYLSISYGGQDGSFAFNPIINDVDYTDYFDLLSNGKYNTILKLTDSNNKTAYYNSNACLQNNCLDTTHFLFTVDSLNTDEEFSLNDGDSYYLNIDMVDGPAKNPFDQDLNKINQPTFTSIGINTKTFLYEILHIGNVSDGGSGSGPEYSENKYFIAEVLNLENNSENLGYGWKVEGRWWPNNIGTITNIYHYTHNGVDGTVIELQPVNNYPPSLESPASFYAPAPGIYFTNNTSLTTGSYNNNTGGNFFFLQNGISLNCAIGYELNWQGGHLKSTYNNGETNSTIYIDSPIQFSEQLVLSPSTPTTDPMIAGKIWIDTANGNVLKVSAGAP